MLEMCIIASQETSSFLLYVDDLTASRLLADRVGLT